MFDERLPADMSRVKELRRALRSKLEGQGVAQLFVERLILVVDEVVSNSIEHGREYRRTGDPLRVGVAQIAKELWLTVDDADMPDDLVADLAGVFNDANGSAPHHLVERGRGMFLISTFLVDVRIQHAEHGGMRLTGRLHDGAI